PMPGISSSSELIPKRKFEPGISKQRSIRRLRPSSRSMVSKRRGSRLTMTTGVNFCGVLGCKSAIVVLDTVVGLPRLFSFYSNRSTQRDISLQQRTQTRGHLRRGRRTPLRVGVEAAPAHRLHLRRHVRAQGGQGRRLATRERRSPREQRVEDRAQAVNVGARRGGTGGGSLF